MMIQTLYGNLRALLGISFQLKDEVCDLTVVCVCFCVNQNIPHNIMMAYLPDFPNQALLLALDLNAKLSLV